MIVCTGKLASWVPVPARCLLGCVNLNSPSSSLYNEDQVTSESSAAWVPYVIVSIMLLISPSCPPGPRPPVKRQDTELSPNLSFSWSSVSDQEVGKQDFLWGCSLWPRQFRFGKQRGDKEHHPGFQTLNPFPWVWYFLSHCTLNSLKTGNVQFRAGKRHLGIPWNHYY